MPLEQELEAGQRASVLHIVGPFGVQEIEAGANKVTGLQVRQQILEAGNGTNVEIDVGRTHCTLLGRPFQTAWPMAAAAAC
jgi:hypothetical protein